MTQLSSQSRQAAALFDQLAPTYESVGVPWFVPIAERLVEEVDPHLGQHAIDIGCGRGAAIPSLAAAVGPHGRVVGIDISSRMLDRAKEGVDLRGLHNVELYMMDAAAPDLPKSSFNIAVASLVLHLLPDPSVALRAWHDLLLPLGRIGIATFAERDADWVELDALFLPYLPAGMIDARTSGEHGPFASDHGVAELVQGAGFEGCQTVRWELPVTFQSPAQWRTWTMSHGQRAMWQSVPEGAREELQRRAAVLLERRSGTGNPITLTQTVRITTAYRSY